jgi:hypothetical protein
LAVEADTAQPLYGPVAAVDMAPIPILAVPCLVAVGVAGNLVIDKNYLAVDNLTYLNRYPLHNMALTYIIP